MLVNLEQISKTRIASTQIEEEIRSRAFLYVGVAIGALLGSLGNFFVSFWFQEVTQWTIWGLVISGILLIGICVVLLNEARRYTR